MKPYILKSVIAIVATGSLIFALLNAAHIGEVFEKKSLYSYQLKTGDLQTGSEVAKTHIKGKKVYGYLIASRVGIASVIIGLIVGAFGALWYSRRRTSA